MHYIIHHLGSRAVARGTQLCIACNCELSYLDSTPLQSRHDAYVWRHTGIAVMAVALWHRIDFLIVQASAPFGLPPQVSLFCVRHVSLRVSLILALINSTKLLVNVRNPRSGDSGWFPP
jgi:hypothetical protein